MKTFSNFLSEYGIKDQEFLTWVRTSVRQSWGDSPMKRHMEDISKFKIINTNPKSMKKYPEVWRIKCNICEQDFWRYINIFVFTIRKSGRGCFLW